MVTLDLSRVDIKTQGPLELMSYLFPFGPHSKPYTKTQLKRPKRLAQLDNQLLWEKHTELWNNKIHELVCMWVLDTLPFFQKHKHITNWETTLIGHQVELEWKLRVFSSASNLWSWISSLQGTLSCSYILKFTWHILSIANEIDPLIFCCVHSYFHHGVGWAIWLEKNASGRSDLQWLGGWSSL